MLDTPFPPNSAASASAMLLLSYFMGMEKAIMRSPFLSDYAPNASFSCIKIKASIGIYFDVITLGQLPIYLLNSFHWLKLFDQFAEISPLQFEVRGGTIPAKDNSHLHKS